MARCTLPDGRNSLVHERKIDAPPACFLLIAAAASFTLLISLCERIRCIKVRATMSLITHGNLISWWCKKLRLSTLKWLILRVLSLRSNHLAPSLRNQWSICRAADSIADSDETNSIHYDHHSQDEQRVGSLIHSYQILSPYQPESCNSCFSLSFSFSAPSYLVSSWHRNKRLIHSCKDEKYHPVDLETHLWFTLGRSIDEHSVKQVASREREREREVKRTRNQTGRHRKLNHLQKSRTLSYWFLWEHVFPVLSTSTLTKLHYAHVQFINTLQMTHHHAWVKRTPVD